MGLREWLQRAERGTKEGRSHTLTLGSSPLGGLLLLPWLLIALISLLPLLLKATWNLAKVAGRVEQLRQGERSRHQDASREDVIDI